MRVAFGDNIQHVLTLEAVTAPEKGVKYPRISEQNEPSYRYCESASGEGRKRLTGSKGRWRCVKTTT